MPQRRSVSRIKREDFIRCCVDSGIQMTFVHPLAHGLLKILADARAAHAERRVEVAEAARDLSECADCATLVTQSGEIPFYVDGDELSRAYDVSLFGEVKPSVDFVLFLEDGDGTPCVGFAEAKLGGTLPSGGRPRHPTRQDLFEKIDYSVKRIGGHVPLCDEAYLLAAKCAVDEQKSRVHRWNQEQSFPMRLECLCLRDFLEEVDAPLSGSAHCDD